MHVMEHTVVAQACRAVPPVSALVFVGKKKTGCGYVIVACNAHCQRCPGHRGQRILSGFLDFEGTWSLFSFSAVVCYKSGFTSEAARPTVLLHVPRGRCGLVGFFAVRSLSWLRDPVAPISRFRQLIRACFVGPAAALVNPVPTYGNGGRF